MEKTTEIKNLLKALAQFHKDVEPIVNDAVNPFHKNRYSTLSHILDSIKKPLHDAGLLVIQTPQGENDLVTSLIHVETGESITSTYQMSSIKIDPQSIGSRITYQRRYALGAMLGLSFDDDDDGNATKLETNNNTKSYVDGLKLNIQREITKFKTESDLTNYYNRTIKPLLSGITAKEENEILAIFKAAKTKILELAKIDEARDNIDALKLNMQNVNVKDTIGVRTIDDYITVIKNTDSLSTLRFLVDTNRSEVESLIQSKRERIRKVYEEQENALKGIQ